ncbi:hypothetical protein [Streptomyces sp. WP-1]|uniref:hypothetical protein n=1 Tax=Streptomyces sp. WP-1 TaxID=3041497 RepID=UPI002648E00A|nr:hypothetical protein [Streptomyces sp. WP-1]WKE67704.1 hypothetical protein QHG49_00965 [Streptomyces sp. WP-1]
MSAWGWTLLLALAAAAAAGRQLYLYPGGWKFAFGPEYGAERGDLDRARGALRGLERSARKELAGARGAVDTAVTAHRRRVRDAEEHIARLRDPGRGAYRDELGALSLYEHVLAVSTDDFSGDLPLHGIAVRSDHTRTAGHLYLVGPDGRQHLVTYATADIAEERVRRFVVDVHNAIAAAKTLRRDRPAQLRQAKAELHRVTNDTSAQEDARLYLEEVTARQNDDLRIPAARKNLAAAHDRWQELTGHRPS